MKMTREMRQIVKDEVAELNSIQPYSYDKYIEFAKKVIERHPLTYFAILKGQRFALIWNDICKKTEFIDKCFKPNAATRIFYYINKLDELVRCETDGKPLLKNISSVNNTGHFFCCNRCAQLHESTVAKTKATKFKNHGDPNYNNMEKNRATCKERYGVECSWQAEEVKQKSKETLQKNLGVDHQMHSQEVKDGMKARYKEKHGVEYAFQDPVVQAKIKAHNQVTLGVDWPMQNKELHAVMHKNSCVTQRKNYFNEAIKNYQTVEAMFTEEEYAQARGQHPFKWRCKACGAEFEQVMFRYGFEPRCLKCKPLLANCSSSNAERDMFNFMCSVNGSMYECFNCDLLNWTTLSDRKQLDIVCKRKDTGKIDLAFEFNGLYWHQSSTKPVGYHIQKTLECERLGIKLVHVWEDEWSSNAQEMKDFIAALLRDEQSIDISSSTVVLDRSKHCKLCIPAGYEVVEETPPSIIERHDSKGSVFMIEDCGMLKCKKTS